MQHLKLVVYNKIPQELKQYLVTMISYRKGTQEVVSTVTKKVLGYSISEVTDRMESKDSAFYDFVVLQVMEVWYGSINWYWNKIWNKWNYRRF